MSKIKLGIVGIVGVFLILCATYTFANNSNFEISDFFKEKESKVEKTSEGSMVVISDEFNITEREYVDYEENIKLIHKTNNIPFLQTEEDIVEQMINKKLLQHYAKSQKIEVTDEEIMNYAIQTKKAFENTSDPVMNELLIGLANSLNVSKEKYFTHPKTLKNYKNVLMVEKAVEQLYEQGIVDDEKYTIDQFTKDLRKEKQDNIHVDLDKLKNRKEN